MSEDDGYDADLTTWLAEAGRRQLAQPPQAQESAEQLLSYLQVRVGRRLRSREEIDRYLSDLEARDEERSRAATRQRIIREVALLLALLVAAGVNHYFDVQLQIARLPNLLVFL